MRRTKTTEKKAKRLALERETLRELESQSLRHVAGGGVEPSPFVPSDNLIPSILLKLRTLLGESPEQP